MSQSSIALGKRIKALRKQNKMSQEELAFNASISTTYLGQIERAEKSPTVETLDKIANALEIPIYDLFSFDINSENNTNTAITSKLNSQLASFSDNEKAELLKLIKSIKRIQKCN